MVKLNGYILSDRIKNEMINKLYETRQDKRQDRKELGSTFCTKSDNIIISRGNHIGNSNNVVIDPNVCDKDEKFLGGYHTHPKVDSNASAGDLIHCGTHKIVCIGGETDNRIKCYTWKYVQLSIEDKYKMVDEYKSGHKSYKYQETFDCINNIGPLYREENDLKKLDKELERIESDLSDLEKNGVTINPTAMMQHNMVKIVRDRRVNILIKDIEHKSKKYYNEVEII